MTRRQARTPSRGNPPGRTGIAGRTAPHTYTPVQMESSTTTGAGRVEFDESLGAETDPQTGMQLLGAREQERSRLAEELHDGPAQALASAIFQVQIVERAIKEDPATAIAELVALREILDGELDTLRSYINQLRPSLAEAEGLDDALLDTASAISERTGIPIDVSLEASGTRLHVAARTAVLRVAQEALRNTGKHSGASRAWVRTRESTSRDGAAQWHLEVGDDGRGFDYRTAAGRNRRHFGLRFMRERAGLLGAELTIETRPDAGTVVRLTIATGGKRS